jgi:hypothetical protein
VFTIGLSQHAADGSKKVQGYVLVHGILQWPHLNTNAETFADVLISYTAIKVYNMISGSGLVDIKKIDGDTYITITKKGDDVSERLLRELIAYEEFVNMNKTDSDEPFKVKKGVKSGVVYDPGLQRVEKRLAEKISEINLPFEEELKTIEED